MCSVRFFEWTAIISLKSSDQLIVVMETSCLFFWGRKEVFRYYLDELWGSKGWRCGKWRGAVKTSYSGLREYVWMANRVINTAYRLLGKDSTHSWPRHYMTDVRSLILESICGLLRSCRRCYTTDVNVVSPRSTKIERSKGLEQTFPKCGARTPGGEGVVL